jgi:hypothetical protein
VGGASPLRSLKGAYGHASEDPADGDAAAAAAARASRDQGPAVRAARAAAVEVLRDERVVPGDARS